MKEIVFRVTSINELHSIAGLEKPKHPLVSVIDYSKVNVADAPESGSFVCSFYTVNFKKIAILCMADSLLTTRKELCIVQPLNKLSHSTGKEIQEVPNAGAYIFILN